MPTVGMLIKSIRNQLTELKRILSEEELAREVPSELDAFSPLRGAEDSIQEMLEEMR